jgi:hypothetical protein
MNNQMQTTLHDRDGPHTYRKTATTVGVIYLLGMVVGIGGNVLIQSILSASDPLAAVGASKMLIAVGAMLWLLAVAGDAAHGILMFPVLKQFSERIAFGYFGARIMDAVFVGAMALLILFQIPLANEYLKAGASDTLQALSAVLNQAQLYAYQHRHAHCRVRGIDAVLPALQDTVASAVPGSLGPLRVRGHSWRVGTGTAGVQPEFHPHDSGRPVGAVHWRVADRQGIQCFARSV